MGGAGAPQTCATLTWDQTQHSPKQEGISVLRVTSEAWGQPALSQSHGAGGSSTGAPSQVTGAHGDIPTSLFLTGLSLVPSLLQLIPHRDCVGSPGREGLLSPSCTEEEPHQSPAHEAARKGVRGPGESQENPIPTPAFPRNVEECYLNCGHGKSHGNRACTLVLLGDSLGFPPLYISHGSWHQEMARKCTCVVL